MISKQLAFSFIALLASIGAATAQPRSYEVNFTNAPPKIDGVVSSGEWNDASSDGSSNWGVLRETESASDAHGNFFQMMFDNEFLYVLVSDEYTKQASTAGGDDIDLSADNINFYFDPNLDDEPNGGPPMGIEDAVDGYQMGFNQYRGSFACGPDIGTCSVETNNNPADTLFTGSNGLGTVAEAHFDTLFGNQGHWRGMRGTRANTVAGPSGSVIELAIPWSDIDAVYDNGEMLDQSMNLEGQRPNDGDVWFFNVARITSDSSNFLPIWNWHSGLFFAQRPHGEITFLVPEPTSVGLFLVASVILLNQRHAKKRCRKNCL